MRTRPLLWVSLVIVAVRLPTLNEPRWYSDEGTFTTVAWLLSRGDRLYADAFDSSPPGIYWLYRALLALGGDQRHVVIQAALLIFVMAAALLTARIAHHLDPRMAVPAALLCGIGLSIPTLDGDLLNVEIAALPFFLAALALAWLRGSITAAGSGLFLALAVTIRPSYALEGLAVLALLVTRERAVLRTLVAAVAGLGGLALAAGILAWQGSWNAYVTLVLPDNRAYLLWANGERGLPLLVRLAVLGVAAAIALGVLGRTRWWLLAVWLPASLAGASITPRGLTHYALEAVPALAITITAILVSVDWSRTHRWLAVPLAGTVGVVTLVAAMEALLILPAQEVALVSGRPAPALFLHNIGYAQLPRYYGRWLSSLGQVEDPRWYPGPIVQEMKAASAIRASESRGPLLVLGDRAWVYVLVQRDAAIRYVALNSAFRLVPSGLDEVRTAVEERRAAVIVLADAPPGDWSRLLRASGYREIAAGTYPIYTEIEP